MFFPTGFARGQGRSRKKLRPFILRGTHMKRVMCYIDGFNLYHAIDELNRPHLKWLNLWALAETILREEERLDRVYYFSAFANWLPDSVRRHRQYVRALEHHGVACVMGHFKEKRRRCRMCDAVTTGHEEKETDVHIGARLVADAYEDNFDRAIIITADSDLAPALKIVRQSFPGKELFVVAPPGRHGHARDLAPGFTLTKGRLASCRLPENARREDGALIFESPASYALPQQT